MAVNQKETMRVFRAMRAALLEKGVKCGLADSGAMASVKLFKWCVKRGCPDAFGFATSEARVAHLCKTYGAA
jgi:hypothetical protein